MTKTTSTTLWDDMAPAEDAPRLPRSTRGAWRAPASASRRAPERPRQTELPGLDEPLVADDESVDESAVLRRVGTARRRSVPRATAGSDVRELMVTRRRLLPGSRAGWIALGVAAAMLLGLMATAAVLLRKYLLHDVHFYLNSSQNVSSLAMAKGDAAQVTRAEILSIFGQDIGRNIFFVPLAARRGELESIPWVKRATVMRVLPDRIYVHIEERTPIAFARVDDTVELVDADGVLLPISPARMALHHYSFPVVTGLNVHPAMASAQERMALYQRFLADLDHARPHASAQVSEIDLSDPDDLRATLSDGGADLLVHFGAENFAARYQMYLAHIAEWHARYPRLIGIDLRFPGDVPLQLASETTNPATAGSASASTGATAAAPAKPQATAQKAARSSAAHTAVKRPSASRRRTAVAGKKAGAAQRRKVSRVAPHAHGVRRSAGSTATVQGGAQ